MPQTPKDNGQLQFKSYVSDKSKLMYGPDQTYSLCCATPLAQKAALAFLLAEVTMWVGPQSD